MNRPRLRSSITNKPNAQLPGAPSAPGATQASGISAEAGYWQCPVLCGYNGWHMCIRKFSNKTFYKKCTLFTRSVYMWGQSQICATATMKLGTLLLISMSWYQRVLQWARGKAMENAFSNNTHNNQ